MFLRKLCLVLVLIGGVAAPTFAHGKPEHGGQAVEVQEHQFELVVGPEANSAHLDLYISDPQDKPVSSARVKLEITAPDGRRISLPLKYGEGHYTAQLTSGAKGNYKVVALSEINGKKLNSRFTFKL